MMLICYIFMFIFSVFKYSISSWFILKGMYITICQLLYYPPCLRLFGKLWWLYSMYSMQVYVSAHAQVFFVKFHDYFSEIMKVWEFHKLYSDKKLKIMKCIC